MRQFVHSKQTAAMILQLSTALRRKMDLLVTPCCVHSDFVDPGLSASSHPSAYLYVDAVALKAAGCTQLGDVTLQFSIPGPLSPAQPVHSINTLQDTKHAA